MSSEVVITDICNLQIRQVQLSLLNSTNPLDHRRGEFVFKYSSSSYIISSKDLQLVRNEESNKLSLRSSTKLVEFLTAYEINYIIYVSSDPIDISDWLSPIMFILIPIDVESEMVLNFHSDIDQKIIL